MVRVVDLLLIVVFQSDNSQSSYSKQVGDLVSEYATELLESLASRRLSESRVKREEEVTAEQKPEISNQWSSVSDRHSAATVKNYPSPSLGMRVAAISFTRISLIESFRSVQRILVFGGYPDAESRVRGSWMYNPSVNSWMSLTMVTQPVDRIGHALVSLCSSEVMLFAGMDNEQKLLNDTWIFDGVRETWSELSVSTPDGSIAPRAFHSGVSLEQPDSTCECKHSVFVYGGFSGLKGKAGGLIQTLSDLWELRCVVEEFGKQTYTWINHQRPESAKISWPSHRGLHQAVPLNETTMFVWGGVKSLETGFQEPDRGSWSFNSFSKLWRFHRVRQPLCTVLQHKGATAYDLQHNQIMYIAGRQSVYSFQRDTLMWKLVKFMKANEQGPEDEVLGLGAVLVADVAVVLGEDSPHYYSSSSGITVWTLKESDGQWLWLLRRIPKASPPAHSMRLWNLVGNGLSSISSPYVHLWYRCWLVYPKYSKAAWKGDRQTIQQFLETRDGVFCFLEILRLLISNFNGHLLQEFRYYAWRIDLETGLQWRYEDWALDDSTFRTSSTAWGDKGLVLYGASIVQASGNSPLSFLKSCLRSYVMVYSLSSQRFLPATTVSKRPKFRVFPTMVQIGNNSFHFFGGLVLDALVYEEYLAKLLLHTHIPDNESRPIIKCSNELWLLELHEEVDYYSKRVVAITANWTLLGPTASSNPNSWPRGRVHHTMVVADFKMFLLGGLQIKRPMLWPPDCFQELWYYDLKTARWHYSNVIREDTPRIISWTSLCRVRATSTGRRIVAVRLREEPDTHSGIHEGDGLVTYLFETNQWVELTNRLPFQPIQIFSWQKLIVAIGNVPRKPRVVGPMNVFFQLYNQDEIQVATLLPGCHKGTSSPNWSGKKCRSCDLGTYAREGATGCVKCGEGLSTYRPGSESPSNCTCDPSYCNHGQCFIATTDVGLSGKCNCEFGYTGGKCQYPTYFIVGGVALGVIAITSLLLVLLRKLIKYRKEKKAQGEELEEMGSAWTIRPAELKLLERVDTKTPGSYGDISKARYRDLTVAVKKLKDIMLSGKVKSDFEREILLMRTIRHPNIVLFIGAGQFNDACPFLVVEFMQEGSLNRIIHNSSIEIAVHQQINFCSDAASGMEFLHSRQPPRIHRDLKSSNLLLSEHWTVKVADFGSARLIKGGRLRQSRTKNRKSSVAIDSATRPLLWAERELSGNVGALLWRAPEIFSEEPYGTPADIYSFGIVMWEIIARVPPYEDIHFDWIDDVRRHICSGARPTMTDSIKRFRLDYTTLMTECWAGDPDKRPTFSEVLTRLSSMQQERRFASHEGDISEMETIV